MTGVREWVETAREERWGILVDLLFAIAWVTLVDVLFQVVQGPTWAYYMMMLTGVVVYFALFWNFELAESAYESE